MIGAQRHACSSLMAILRFASRAIIGQALSTVKYFIDFLAPAPVGGTRTARSCALNGPAGRCSGREGHAPGARRPRCRRVRGSVAVAQPRPLPGFMPKTPDYLNAAAQSDRFEIIEGDLAARYSATPGDPRLRQRMIRDHARAPRSCWRPPPARVWRPRASRSAKGRRNSDRRAVVEDRPGVRPRPSSSSRPAPMRSPCRCRKPTPPAAPTRTCAPPPARSPRWSRATCDVAADGNPVMAEATTDQSPRRTARRRRICHGAMSSAAPGSAWRRPPPRGRPSRRQRDPRPRRADGRADGRSQDQISQATVSGAKPAMAGPRQPHGPAPRSRRDQLSRLGPPRRTQGADHRRRFRDGPRGGDRLCARRAPTSRSATSRPRSRTLARWSS